MGFVEISVIGAGCINGKLHESKAAPQQRPAREYRNRPLLPQQRLILSWPDAGVRGPSELRRSLTCRSREYEDSGTMGEGEGEGEKEREREKHHLTNNKCCFSFPIREVGDRGRECCSQTRNSPLGLPVSPYEIDKYICA